MPATESRRIVRGIAGGVFLTAVTIVFNLVQLRLVITFLPGPLAGSWVLFLTLGFYVAYFDLGFSPTIAREISFVQGERGLTTEEREQQIADLLATCRAIFTAIALGVLVVAQTLGAWFLNHVSDGAVATEVVQAWRLFALGATVQLWNGSSYAGLYGLGFIGTERVVRAVGLLSGLSLLAATLVAGYGIQVLGAVWLAQHLIIGVLALVLLRIRHPALRRVRGRAGMEIVRRILMPSLKWAATGLGAILILQTDNIVIASMADTALIPAYEAVAKIAATFMTLSLLIVTASSPFISRAYASRDEARIADLVLRNARYATALMVFLVAFMSVLGDRVIGVWLGPGNFVGYDVVWTMMAMALLEVHHVVLATAVMATGRIIFVAPALIAGVLNIVVSVVLIGPLGLWGVALGTFLSQLLTNNWYVPAVSLRLLGISWKAYTRVVVAPLLLLLGILLALDSLIARNVVAGLNPIVALVLSFALCGLVAVLLFAVVTLNAAERKQVLGSLLSLRLKWL